MNSYLDLGSTEFGYISWVLWYATFVSLKHVPAFATEKQVTSGLISLLPGGNLKPPERSSPEGSDASQLLEHGIKLPRSFTKEISFGRRDEGSPAWRTPPCTPCITIAAPKTAPPGPDRGSRCPPTY